MLNVSKRSLSIVIPTFARRNELKNLLDSIVGCDIVIDYEIIIVDQNEDKLIDELVLDYKATLPIVHEKVSFKGSSKARNHGVAISKGNIVCFPDDDAEFREDTVTKALRAFEDSEADCVFGKCIDKESGLDSVIYFKSGCFILTKDNFENAFVEATMFAKRELFNEFIFDEKMGVGTIFGSQEGYDLVYRLLCAGKRLFYDSNIIYYHPNKVFARSSETEIRRAFYYSCGFGYLCKKHRFSYKFRKRKIALILIYPALCLFRRSQRKYYSAQIMGISLGYQYL